MKGDEGVELSKEVANLLLFDGAWHIQKHVFDLAKVNTFYGCSSLAKLKGSARKVAHFGSWPSMAR